MKRLERNGVKKLTSKPGTIITGTLFAPILKKTIDKLNLRFRSKLTVLPVSNNYFGGDVSVPELLTGGDLINARDQIEGELVLIPKQMLKSDEAINA